MKNNLSYRGEVDGLRALAILFVVLYHSRFTFNENILFKGGYIGVDVFFVISGYLISRLIFSEIHNQGKVNFLHFFNKRIRRIFPALIFLIISISPVAYIILMPQDFIEYCESVLSSLFFSSNIYFYFDQITYAAESSLLKPLLHTWSLGIEEQFYLILPFLIVLIFKLFNKKYLICLILLFSLSLLFAEYFTNINKNLSFYFLQNRLWEISTGAIIALFEVSNKKINFGNFKYSNDFGLALILFSFFYFDANTAHPGLITLIPTLGTALVLIKNEDNQELIFKYLHVEIVKKIGVLSYSFYLWHFPILAFYRHKNIDENNLHITVLIFLSLAVSVFSYKFVEAPFRNIEMFGNKLFYNVLIFLILIISTISILFITKSITYDSNDKENVSYLLDKSRYRQEHLNFEVSYDYKLKNNKKESILIVGNSHAEDLLQILSFSDIQNNYEITLTSSEVREEDMNYQISCFEKLLFEEDTKCPSSVQGKDFEFGPNILNQYRNSKYILLATRWSVNDLKRLEKIIIKLVEDRKKVIIVSNSPESEVFGVKKLNIFDKFLIENKRLPIPSELLDLEKEFYAYYIKTQEDLNNEIKKIVYSFKSSDVRFADRTEFMCNFDEKRCLLYFYEFNAKIFWDYGHITKESSKIFADIIDSNNWINFIETMK